MESPITSTEKNTARIYYNFRCPLTIGMCQDIINHLRTNPTKSDVEIALLYSQKLNLTIHRLVIAHLRITQHIYLRFTSSAYQNLRYCNQGYNYRLYLDQLTPDEAQYFRNAKQHC